MASLFGADGRSRLGAATHAGGNSPRRGGTNPFANVLRMTPGVGVHWRRNIYGTELMPNQAGEKSWSALAVAANAQGNIYVGAEATRDACLLKLDAHGQLQWTFHPRPGVPAYCNSVAVKSNGDVVAAIAVQFSVGVNEPESGVYQLTSSGQQQWFYSTRIDPSSVGTPNVVASDAQGSVYVGRDALFGVDNEALLKLDHSGALVWGYDRLNVRVHSIVTGEAGVFASGARNFSGVAFAETDAVSAGGQHLWHTAGEGSLVLNAAGTVLHVAGDWLNRYDTSDGSIVGSDAWTTWFASASPGSHAVARDQDGHYLITGIFRPWSSGTFYPWHSVCRISSDYQLLWTYAAPVPPVSICAVPGGGLCLGTSTTAQWTQAA